MTVKDTGEWGNQLMEAAERSSKNICVVTLDEVFSGGRGATKRVLQRSPNTSSVCSSSCCNRQQTVVRELLSVHQA